MKSSKIKYFLAIPFFLLACLVVLGFFQGKKKGCFPSQDLPAFMAPTESPDSVSFIALGDAGKSNSRQRATFASATQVCRAMGCDFALMLGDNFYPKGLKKVSRKKLNKTYKNLLGELGIPIYVILGNHDVKRSYQAQINLKELEPLWNMPATRYNFTAGPAHFVGLNSNCQGMDLFWGADVIAESQKKWQILFQHHTLFSTGSHGDAPPPIGLLWEQFGPANLDLFLSGHDHHLEHLTKRGQKAQYVVSGSVSRPTRRKEHDSKAMSHFKLREAGFVWVNITLGEMEVRFYDSKGQQLYQTVITK